nr:MULTISPECIES: TetR family transcriptional regulator [unclassified Bordetella]
MHTSREDPAGLPAAERILLAAKELVARKGPFATTVRDICEVSNANVAAVNYYFGSKDALVRQVLLAILEPVNIERSNLLQAARERYDKLPIPVPVILDALLRPLVQAERSADGGRLFLRIENHLRAIPDSEYTLFVGEQLNHYAQIFLDAMAEALPQFTRAELIWRYEFVRGSALHLLSNCDPLSQKFRVLKHAGGMINVHNDELVLRELILSAMLGLSAPAAWTDQDVK